jgi:RND family efflux transporter MFP subunit
MNRYFLILILTTLTAGCKPKVENKIAESDARMGHWIAVNEVDVDTLALRPFERELVSNGKLTAYRRSKLSFQQSGIITKINGDNGARIAKGETIASIDDSDQRLDLERAELALKKSHLSFLDELVKLGYKLEDTITPPKEVVDLARIRSGYADAQMSYTSAKRNLAQCVLRAPFSGKIADLNQKPYERVSGDFCLLLDDSYFTVHFVVLESEYGFLKEGQNVIVSPYTDLRKEIEGKISAVNPTINDKGQVEVDAIIANDGTLTDGMNVKVFIHQKIGDMMVVKKSAVVIRDNLEVLFRYENGKALWTYVHTSLSNSREYVVEPNTERGATLNIGDIIITSGNLNLADGSSVSIKE